MRISGEWHERAGKLDYGAATKVARMAAQVAGRCMTARRSPFATTVRLGDRIAARMSMRAKAPGALSFQPEPRSTGLFAQGQQILAGNFLVMGELIISPGAVPWQAQTEPARAALHGFGWLDHLAVVGDRRARLLAQAGLDDWIEQFGRGAGPGWTPMLAGRRVIRWLSHGLMLMAGRDKSANTCFLRALAAHALFLTRRAATAPPGLPRIEALTGLLYASLSIEGHESRILPTGRALAIHARDMVVKQDAIASRNAEELLEVFTLLTWAAQALVDRGQPVEAALDSALARISRTLRVLRHADGALARFHGGGRGTEGQLSAALSLYSGLAPAAWQQDATPGEMAMGYARLAASRSSVIIDAAPPPGGAHAVSAHASTLAFELTSNRRALVVNCGSGQGFGGDWARASRATASHSTLSIDGFSSARFANPTRAGRSARLELTDGPRAVTCSFRHQPYARAVTLSHDGYALSHGLEHLRHLDLSADGRVLSGEDSLVATGRAASRRFDQVHARSGGQGVSFALRFHLHPEADASVDMNGAAVSIVLRSGEIWVFRFDGPGELALAPSVYLEKGRLKPRPSRQIVLSGRARGYTSQINWSFAKAHDTPNALRDMLQDDPMSVPDW